VASSSDYVGWGSGPWSRGSYGLDLLVVSVDGSEAAGAVGLVEINLHIADLVGIEVVGYVGTVEAGNATVFATGLQLTGYVGAMFLWGDVDDNSAPNWQNIGNSGGTVWSPVADTQIASWHDVAA
jgi:hypothetical protein